MNILVTGASGFIGSYLVNSLQQSNSVVALSRSNSTNLSSLRTDSKFFSCDLSNDSLKDILKGIEPDEIYHLAAQTNVPVSWQSPIDTFKQNVNSTIALLEWARSLKNEPRIHLVSASAIYGSVLETETPISEDAELRPTSPYAVSKLASDMLGYSYWKSYGMKITRSRPFLIVGPGKDGGVFADFAKQMITIEKNNMFPPKVGNLSIIRDFLDVRDCVKALRIINTKGKAGEVYNLCSGKGVSLGYLLASFMKIMGRNFKIESGPIDNRPSQDMILIGNNTKLKKLGWGISIPLEQTITDTLNFIRKLSSS